MAPLGVATLLVSPSPLSDADVDALEAAARRLRFDIVVSPRHPGAPMFEALTSGRDPAPLYAQFPVNIAPPTDNSPFFFHTLRLRDIFQRDVWRRGARRLRRERPGGLGARRAAADGGRAHRSCASSCRWRSRPIGACSPANMPLFVFFASIGFGFMLVEISQMQRLIVFLGHPTYGLSVVLFAMLASSGWAAW